ncbi:MAG TPA: elongation factor P [Planctomycetes bacterium]|nr:elongation factor P [Planctomycetota bacterium]
MGRRATEIRKGNVLLIDGSLWTVTDYDHHTPGNLRSIIRLGIKNLSTGQSKQIRAGSGDTFEVAFLETRKCQYLYRDSGDNTYVFMDNQDYEQYHLQPDLVGDAMNFVKEEDIIDVTFYEGQPISVELPGSVVLTVTEAEPSAKGNTVSGVSKKAKVETGLEIKVPAHISAGEKVKISTQTGEFLGRAND